MSNIETIKLATTVLNKVFDTETPLPGLKVAEMYHQILSSKFSPGGTHTYIVCLNYKQIDSLVLNTHIDVSSFTSSDVESDEFKQLLDTFVLCVGKCLVRYLTISETFLMDDLINVVTKTLLLDFSE